MPKTRQNFLVMIALGTLCAPIFALHPPVAANEPVNVETFPGARRVALPPDPHDGKAPKLIPGAGPQARVSERDRVDSMVDLMRQVTTIPAKAPVRPSRVSARNYTQSSYTQSESGNRGDMGAEDGTKVKDRSPQTRIRQLLKPVTDIRVQAWPTGQGTPENLAREYETPPPEIFVTASGASSPLPDRYSIRFCHRPLYFEQPNLERCGIGYDYFQNLISGAQFLANTIVLPYHMGKTRPDCTVATRGDCRCCESFPCQCNPFPLDCHGSALEAASLAGFSFLLL